MTHAWVNKYASMWCSEMMFITLLCEFSPFINTLLCETSKTDRIWTLRCGKRKNILAKQINSALSPWGSAMLRPSQSEALASTSLPSPSQSDEVWRWSITALMGNVITTEMRKIGYTHLLYEAPHWQASVLPYRAKRSQIHWGHIQYYTKLFVSIIVLYMGCYSQDVYFEMAVKEMVQTQISIIAYSPSCFKPVCRYIFCGTQMLTFLKNLWYIFPHDDSVLWDYSVFFPSLSSTWNTGVSSIRVWLVRFCISLSTQEALVGQL